LKRGGGFQGKRCVKWLEKKKKKIKKSCHPEKQTPSTKPGGNHEQAGQNSMGVDTMEVRTRKKHPTRGKDKGKGDAFPER